MWKKLLAACIALVGTFSVGCAYFNMNTKTDAATVTNAGGNATGRIGTPKRGDRFTLSINDDGMQLLKQIDNGIWYAKPAKGVVNTPISNGLGYDVYMMTTIDLYPIVTNLNSSLSAQDKKIIFNHTFDSDYANYNCTGCSGAIIASIKDYHDNVGVNGMPYFFIPTQFEERDFAHIGFDRYGLSVDDLAFGEDYIGNLSFFNSLNSTLGTITDAAGNTVACSSATVHPFRPSILLDLTKIVFAVSANSNGSSTLTSITEPTIGATSGTATGDAMKVRLLDTDLKVNFDRLMNKEFKDITEIGKGGMLEFGYSNASTGTDQYISLIFTDENGKFKYYMVTDLSKGNGVIEVSTADLAVGKYKVALVNEVITNQSDPTISSAITAYKDIEIVKPLSDLTFKSQANLQIDNNVNAGDTVGTISSQNGAGTPTYTIIADPAYPNEYQNVALASDGRTVIVNGSPLNAGTYHFKIRACDENGDPDPALEIFASISVSKKSTAIAFDNPNQTKKSITDAIGGWNETATMTPDNSDTKITYAKVSGDIGLIDIDPDTGAIIYKGNGSYGKVTIRATADDLDSNIDNYDSAYVEKEIVIYSQVDGSVVPHANSSDVNVPTFTTSDANVKSGGTIGTIKGAPGTPDNVSGGTITYTYGLKSDGDGSFFAVNSSTGVITTKANLAVGSYHITVTVSDKWSTKDIPVTINVGMANAENLQFYESKTSNTVINTKTVNFSDTGIEVYATVKGSGNNNPVTYTIKDGSTNVIEVNPTSGAVTIHGAGTVTIVATKKGNSGQADAVAELTFTVTAGSQNFIYTTDSTLSKEMPKNAATGKYNPYEETYAPNKTFNVYTTGNPSGTVVTYQLKAGSSNDVISVDSDGTIHILNASRSGDVGHVSIEAISHDPNGNYADKTIELPITINRGTRSVEFADDPIYAVNGNSTVTPVIHVDGVPDTSGTAVIEVDPNESSIAWTNNGIDVEYSYSGDDGKDITLQVSLPGNRNYENATGKGTLHILGADEAMLTVSTPGKIIYGDHFTIRSTQDDSASTNVQYRFTVSDPTYISNPKVNGKQAEFDALKYSGNTEITVTVTRTADGEVPLSKKVKVKVLPKPISIAIEDKNKLKGEANPTLTVQSFNSQLVSWNGVPDVIQPNDIHLNTTANQNSPAGSYPITGNANSLNNTYPNYTFTMTNGNLTIIEENIEDHWYHLETDDGQPYNEEWTNHDVNIISDHSEYVNLSSDQSTWKGNFITISKEGNNEIGFWMKKDSGAITSEKKERIKIDKTAPKVKNIKAKDSNNTLQDIINKLSGGIFFKPDTTFEITTDDSNGKLDVSGTKSIAYQIYKTDKQKRTGDELIKEDVLTITSEKASFTIDETAGTYKICVIPTDEAGNSGEETCHEVELKKIDVDVDGDDKPDFNDPDGDGCPDLNIKWKGDDGKWVVINGDRDNDGIPDLNIDSDGDGKPDLNLDTDGDGKPDLNLVILKKSDWKPTTCVNADETNGILEEYCTGTNVKAQINVDLDSDGIPDINIDNNGDMKADYQIDTNSDQKADMNRGPILNEWRPDFCTNKGFIYCTMKTVKPVINIDTDGDGRPDMNIDLDDDGEPDINIDTDGDGIPNVDIDSDGDGNPDVNVDTDGDGTPDENIIEIKEWKPEHNVDDPFPYDTMKLDDPSPEDPSTNDPNKPDEPANQKPDDSNNTDVKGSYYPGVNAGGAQSISGALTGDSTNIMMYIGTGCVSIGMMLWVAYKKKQEE